MYIFLAHQSHYYSKTKISCCNESHIQTVLDARRRVSDKQCKADQSLQCSERRTESQYVSQPYQSTVPSGTAYLLETASCTDNLHRDKSDRQILMLLMNVDCFLKFLLPNEMTEQEDAIMKVNWWNAAVWCIVTIYMWSNVWYVWYRLIS